MPSIFESLFGGNTSAKGNTSGSIRGITTGLPGLMSRINELTLPYLQSQQNAAEIISPQQAELAAKIAAMNKQSDANLAAPGGAGANLFNNIMGLDKTANSEFYKTRESNSKLVNDLVGSYDLSGLSPAELNVAERGVNRSNVGTGNLNSSSALKTVGNAMSYGREFNAKRDAAGKAAMIADDFLSKSKGLDPNNVIFGTPSATGTTKTADTTGVSNIATGLQTQGASHNGGFLESY